MVKVTVVLKEDRDAEVIEWLRKQPNMSGAILEILREAIAPSESDPKIPTWGVDLGAIRQVFEAVLDERLSDVRLVEAQGGNSQSEHGEDPQLAARLDALEF